jgi:hypothetical protein
MNGPAVIGGLSLAGMQMSWLALSVLVLNRRVAADSLPGIAILFFYPLSLIVNLLLRSRIRGWKHLLLLNGTIGFWVFGILLGFQVFVVPAPTPESWLALVVRFFNPDQVEFLIFVSSAISWGLGCRLAVLKISFSALFSEFQFGLALLFIALFAEHRLQMNLPHLVPLILLFFSFALVGVGVTHGREHAGWTSSGFFSTWFVFLFVAVALVLSAGLLITVLASPAFVQFLLSILYRAGEFLLGVLGRILGFLISLLPLPESSLPPLPPSSAPASRPEDWSPFFLISDSTREILRVLWTLMVSSLLIVALWRISSQILDWLRRRMGTANGDEVEPLPGAFRADLRILLLWVLDTLSLKWLFRLLTKRKRRSRESDSLRQSYIRLLQWAAAKGCRRGISQTPFDFLPRLVEFLPEAREDFTFITRNYVRARYGASPPAGEVFQEVKDRWENIQRVEGQEKRRRKKKRGRGNS